MASTFLFTRQSESTSKSFLYYNKSYELIEHIFIEKLLSNLDQSKIPKLFYELLFVDQISEMATFQET